MPWSPRPLSFAIRALLVFAGAVRAELPVPAEVWVGAGQASREVSGATMTIHQQSDKAILNWQSFDIGQNNAVHFRQPSAAAIALNRIAPGDQPSRILGTLDANGQIYLVNPNGFVFGPKARVDVNALTATTLNISDQAFQRGLTKVIEQSQGNNPLPALSGGSAPDARITVEKGAKLSTHAAGGRILLAAPEIENRGKLSAPDGQIILAGAKDKMYLQEADPASNLRGILVEVGSGGEVRNFGKLHAPRGNITAIGYAVYQAGRVSASTSVSLNGTVRLLAREGATLERASDGKISLKPDTTRRADGSLASVQLATGSQTRITLDASGGKAVDEQTQTRSRVEVSGGRVRVKRGAAIVAPGSEVNLTATQTPDQPLRATTPDNRSRIVLEAGSKIDVSGSRKTVLPMARNVVAVELRDNELRDAPLQKTGVLHGQTIQVDIRKGTPLADISGAVARIQRSVDERNATGGTVALNSEGDVLVERGATVNISGGAVRYRGGRINTTSLLADGRVYDIATADPNRHYDGILGQISRFHPRWNITQTWNLPGPVGQGGYESGYTDGKAAGTLSIKSRNLWFDGTLKANTVTGRYQRELAQRPSGGVLDVDLAWSGQRQQAVVLQTKPGAVANIDANAPFPGVEDGGILPPLVLTERLFKHGLARLKLSSAGRVTLAEAMQLKLPVRGALDLSGGELDILGTIRAPSGKITLATQPGGANAETLSGVLHVGKTARLDTAGTWINDQPGSESPLVESPLSLDGGKVSLTATGDLVLDAGSRIAVDGGAWLARTGKVTAGKGGEISLKVAAEGASRLDFGAAVSGYGLEQGGRLALTANAIRIGTDTATTTDPTTLALSPERLLQGGFATLSLTANGGNLTVTAGTRLNLQAASWELVQGYLDRPTRTPMAALTRLTRLPDYFRQPVDLALSVVHDANVGRYSPTDSLAIAQGAVIQADPGAKLSLSSDANLWIDGTLAAPAGRIAATINPVTVNLDPGYDAQQAIRLGPSAQLLVPGATLLKPNSAQLRLGDVKPGGEVELRANRGYVVLDSGAVIDASGTVGALDIPDTGTGTQTRWHRTPIPSHGGDIRLTAAEGMILDGTLKAAAGSGAGASGGTLSLTLDAQARGLSPDNLPADAAPIPVGPRVIHLSQEPTRHLASSLNAETPLSDDLNGQAYLSARQVKAGGFASLTLNTAVMVPDQPEARPSLPAWGEVRFDSAVSLYLANRLTLDTPGLAWAGTDSGVVALNANTLSLGSSLNRQNHDAHLTGAGQLRAQANWIDLSGASELRGFQKAALTSRNDIRLLGVNPSQEGDVRGELSTAGDLELSARQIYPGTFSQFAVRSDNRIAILPGDLDVKAPLSAGGSLSLTAPRIEQQGILRAPLGTLNLTATDSLTLAPNSLTSVSAQGLVIPFGRTQGDLDWLFPLGALQRVIVAPPAKDIALAAPDIRMQDGAQIDLGGGGDLHAFEFVPGPGGSVDTLAPAANTPHSYAVLPSLGSAFAPYDPIDSPGSGLALGDSLYLAGGGGLAAGRYVLLPAHYALLPGAFLITPETGTTDLRSGYTRLDGAAVVAGYRYTAGTAFKDARWSGYAVEPGAIARTRSEYHEHLASQFFTDPSDSGLPQDGGHLSLSVSRTLELAGHISAAGIANGRGGQLDIAADRLTLVQTRDQAAGRNGTTVRLAADDVNRLGVTSVFIGGRRSHENNVTRLNVVSDTVTVQPGTQVQGQDLILAARQHLTVGDNARIAATGTNAATSDNLKTDAGSAVLRITTGDQSSLTRDADPAASPATLTVASGAELASSGSLLLSGAGNVDLRGRIAMTGGSLFLGAGRIGLGDAPAGTQGLVLNAAQLDQLQVDELRLASLGPLDLFGAVDFSAQRLTISSAGLYGHGQAEETARISADTLRLDNPDQATATAAATGQGRLVLAARELQLGSGSYGWQGFNDIDMAATDALVASGTTTLHTGAPVHIAAGKISATAGANLDLVIAGGVVIDPLAGGKPTSIAEGLGARLTVDADTIILAGALALPAGTVALKATAGIALDSGAVIDTTGRAVTLGDNTAYASGGSVSLNTAAGHIAIAPGARLDVSAAPGGGDAGSLALAAPTGRIFLDGDVQGRAGTAGEGGSFAMDALDFGGLDFPSLNSRLYSGGFTQAMNLRQRQGDLLIDPGIEVQAHNIQLTADVGGIWVAGRLNASGAKAGHIGLAAGQDIRLESSARLFAAAHATGAAGGRVELAALGDGGLDSGVHIAPGARIDVSPGMGGAGGTVAVRVGQVGTDDAAVDIAPGTVAGASDRTVEAVRVYRDPVLDNAQLSAWRTAMASYIDAANANLDLSVRLGGFSLKPGLEIQTRGDLNLDLSEALKTHTWSQDDAGTWHTRLDEVAGGVNTLTQVAADGSVRTLTAASSSTLNRDGSYFFDSDPTSPTFRELFVRVFPDNRQSGLNRYHPGLIADTLVEHNGWDFLFPTANGQTWRFGSQQTSGILTLRATGNLTIGQDVSDGFALYSAQQLAELFQIDGTVPNWRPTLMLQPGFSWVYRLVAGADLAGAHPLALSQNSTHSLTLGAGVAVRTGTGDIDAAASGDICFTDAESTLFTAGRPTAINRYGSFGTDLASKAFYAEYPLDGGAISLNAGRDILGATTPQLMSDWLVRTGAWNPDDGLDAKDRPTAWGIAFDTPVLIGSSADRVQNLKFGFRQNIGALGGGDVSITAGGNIRDISAVLPTTAKPIGPVENGQIVENRWQLRGGGDLTVRAGGDIAGGVFYVERGTAQLKAQGAVSGGSQYQAGPLFALGDAQFRVAAGQGIAVGAVFNPFALKAPYYPDKTAYFSTYSPTAALDLTSAAGDVALNNDTALIREQYRLFDAQTPTGRSVLNSTQELAMLTLYPGSLRGRALSGDLTVTHSFDLFPAARGDLELFAARNIYFGTTEQVVVSQSDSDPSLLLTPTTPAASLNDTAKRLDIFQPVNASFLHAATPVHTGDTAPVRVVAAQGDILAAPGSLLSTAKPTQLSAGRDIVGLGVHVQNLDASDTSEVRAGRDIRFPILRDAYTGELDSTLDSLSLSVSGPGRWHILAGRDIDLGTSAGIVSLGNLVNPALSPSGAALAVLAGLTHEPDYAGFIKNYLSSHYGDALLAYVGDISGTPPTDAAMALQRFHTLDPALRREFILAVLFQELQTAGQAAAATRDPVRLAAAYRRGERAIATLFPGENYPGDISLFFSKIQTLSGGDIQLLAPGGGIDAGLASAFAGNKAAQDLGIVAQREGAVNALTRDDIQVNQARVFTLDGGDITLWSRDGDIDAGRGAKAALAAPAPVYSFDAKGNLVVTFPPVVSGSGIRAQSGFSGATLGATARTPALSQRLFGGIRTPGAVGDVTLVAPHGVVDAGEAGIGGRNVAIAATAIIGVANIQATATLTGAPPPAPAFATSLTGASQLAAGANQAADTALAESVDNARQITQPVTAPMPVNLLSVEVIGFGDCGLADIRQGKPGCQP